jgi:alpha-D-ribose 1-methylphosphonate 5-triphosphate synthase subunit PhnH
MTTYATSTGTEVRRPVRSRSLSPDDAQRIFRAVLETLARPGTVWRLPDGPLGDLPAALLPVLALADLTTPACVLQDVDEAGGGEDWAEYLRTMTSAPLTGVTGARLASVLRPLAPGELSGFPTGSAAQPERGALVCLAVSGIESEPAGSGPLWRLSGPGVPGSRPLRVRGLPDDFLACRNALIGDFPAGVDLLFAAPDGSVAGLPRTTAVTKEAD